MSCRQTRLLLSVRREWTPRDHARAERHLSSCPACQAVEREYQLMDRRLNRLPEPSVALILPSTMRGHPFSGRQKMTIKLACVPRWALQSVVLMASAVLLLLTVLAWQGTDNFPPSSPDSKGAAPSAVPLPTPGPAREPSGLLWPASGRVAQGYSAWHRALDIANDRGTAIYAIADGIVSLSGQNGKDGIHILLEHSEGYTSFYSHLEVALIEIGEPVEQGQVIGLMGDTGLSTGPHLHFQVRKDGEPINPLEVLPEMQD